MISQITFTEAEPIPSNTSNKNWGLTLENISPMRKYKKPRVFFAIQIKPYLKSAVTSVLAANPISKMYSKNCRNDAFHIQKKLKSSRKGWLAPVLSHYHSCGSASGGSVVQRCACALHYLFLALSVLILYSRFPTYPQISNLLRATAIFKYQINSVCLFTTVKSFPLSIFIDFFGTTTRTDFCMFSHILQYGLLRNEYFITLQSLSALPRLLTPLPCFLSVLFMDTSCFLIFGQKKVPNVFVWYFILCGIYLSFLLHCLRRCLHFLLLHMGKVLIQLLFF